jgi:hypothetical protein
MEGVRGLRMSGVCWKIVNAKILILFPLSCFVGNSFWVRFWTWGSQVFGNRGPEFDKFLGDFLGERALFEIGSHLVDVVEEEGGFLNVADVCPALVGGLDERGGVKVLPLVGKVEKPGGAVAGDEEPLLFHSEVEVEVAEGVHQVLEVDGAVGEVVGADLVGNGVPLRLRQVHVVVAVEVEERKNPPPLLLHLIYQLGLCYHIYIITK